MRPLVMQSRGAVALALLALVVATAGCDGFSDRPSLPKPSLGGTVRDASTGRSVANASVSVQGKQASTNERGHYFIEDLREGRFVVTVTHAAYFPVQREVRIYTGGIGVTAADFELLPLP